MLFYSMLAINLIYVAIEFLFNFVLLNTTSSQVSMDDIHYVEVVGRCLASFGFTFIIWKIIQSRKVLNTKKKIMYMIISGIIVYPAFYFAQEKVVDHLAENSTMQTKETNNYLFLVKQGLINGSIQLDTVPYNSKIKDLPESKVFVSNISLFMINNNAVLNYIKTNKDKVAYHVFSKEINTNLDSYYKKYTDGMVSADIMWESYQRANSNNDINLNNVEYTSNQAFNNMNATLEQKYNDYKRAQRYVSKNIDKQFNRYVRHYIITLEQPFKCSDDTCINKKMNTDFFREMSKFNGARDYPLPTQICKKSNSNTSVLRIYLDGKLKVADKTNWKNVAYNTMDCYISQRDLLIGFNKTVASSFSQKTGVSNPNISSYEEFVNQPEIKNTIKNEVAKKNGIEITKDFNPASRNSFTNAIKGSANSKFIGAFNKETTEKYGVQIPVGITNRDIFYSQASVQKILKDKLGVMYVDGIKPDMNKEQFKTIAVTSIAKNVATEFLNKDLNSVEGKKIVKAMIVPPIALFLSLFFGFVNAVILIKTIISKVLKVKNVNMVSNIIAIAFIAILITIPAMLSNKYTESDSYVKVYGNMKEYNVFMAESVNWIMKLEPFVYSYGETFIK